MNSSCRAAATSSKMFITSVALHRNGQILKFLVSNKYSFFLIFLFSDPGCDLSKHFLFCYIWVYQCVFLTGDTLYYRFMSDMSNTEWGYKFTIAGGHRGRFQTGTFLQTREKDLGKRTRRFSLTRSCYFWWSSHPFSPGFEILKQMLGDEQLLGHLPLADIWEWQVGVACRQTGSQRLKAIHLLLRLLQCQSQT